MKTCISDPKHFIVLLLVEQISHQIIPIVKGFNPPRDAVKYPSMKNQIPDSLKHDKRLQIPAMLLDHVPNKGANECFIEYLYIS